MTRPWELYADIVFQSLDLVRLSNGQRGVQCHVRTDGNWEVRVLHGVGNTLLFSPHCMIAGLAGSRDSAIHLARTMFLGDGPFPNTAYDRKVAPTDYGPPSAVLGFTDRYPIVRYATDYHGPALPAVERARQQRRLGIIRQ